MSNIRSGSKSVYLSESGNNPNRITLEAPFTIDNDYTFTFPSTMGNYGEMLMTYGSTTSWELPGRVFRTVVSTNSYNILVSDRIIGVTYTTTGTVDLYLPSTMLFYARITIVDEGGMAGTNNITIHPNGFDTIIGQTSLVINSDYNSVSLYNNGVDGKWFIG